MKRITWKGGMATKLTAVALLACTYLLARPTVYGDARTGALAARFAFVETPLPLPAQSPALHSERNVHPSLAGISGWISSVGAGVALADLDGDGLPNDLCHVDPRTNQIVVSPVPGSGQRYAAFALDPAPLHYDAARMAPMGCTPNDMNEDGSVDLLAYYWGRPPIAFLADVGTDGTPPPAAGHYRPVELVPALPRWHTNAATFADVDGDGHADLIVGNYFPDDADVLGDGGRHQQMQDSMSRAYNGGRNHVLLWRRASAGAAPTVEFTVTEPFPDIHNSGWTLALGAADLDGDLLPELYVANDFGPDVLFHNRSQRGRPHFEPAFGQRHFTTPRSKVLGRDSFKGMGMDFGDIDGDGRLDMFVSNIAQAFALQESHFMFINTGHPEQLRSGRAPFEDRSEPLGVARSGWGWDTRLGDFDNDGATEALQAVGFLAGTVNRWPELHEIAMGNDFLLRFPGAWHRFFEDADLSGGRHNAFYVRGEDGRFHDVAAHIGLGRATVSRGIASADVDGDGRLDFAVANQWQPSYFYANRAAAPGQFLGLHLLHSPGSAATSVHRGHPTPGMRGYAAIGAQASIALPGRVLVSQVDGGNGHSGKRSPDLHFGLGQRRVDSLQVTLRWRDHDGHPQRQVLQLQPGWHTVILGRPADTIASQSSKEGSHESL